MKSKFLNFIDGYEDTRLGKHFVSFSYSGSVSSKNRKSRSLRIHKVGEGISSFLAATRSTFYGALFISFGLAALLFYFLNEFAGAYEGRNLVTLILGIVCSLVSIPFLLVDKPSHRMISESRILDYIFFEFLCMKRGWSPADKRGAPTILGVVLGIALAALGILWPLGNVALAIGALALVYLSFSSPEFPYLLSLLLIPYSSYIPNSAVVLAFLAILSFVSFFRKTLSGKRVMNIEQYDVLIFIMLILVCIYTAITRENVKITDYLIILSLFMGYSLSSNIITNRRLADSISNGLVVATLPLALYVDTVTLISYARGQTPPEAPFALASSVVVSTVLSIRLIKHSVGAEKAAYIVLLALYSVSVLIISHPLYAIALALGILTTALYRAGKYFSLLIAPLCLLISFLHLLPETLREPVYRLLHVESPTLVETMFSSPVGFSMFALVMLLIIVRVRHRIVYSVFFEGTHLTSISVGYAGAIVALMLMLATSSEMLSEFTLYLLLAVFGMGSAALRVAKSENDNAELYVEDSKSIDSSTVNIRIH